MRRKHGSQEEETAIDLTPMLDVVFIMLIFFIVTASFVKESGLDIIRPQNNQQDDDEEENKNILVTIDQTQTILIDRLRVDRGSVLPRLKQLLADRPEAAVVISSSEGANIETYSLVHEAANLAGVQSVIMATQQ